MSAVQNTSSYDQTPKARRAYMHTRTSQTRTHRQDSDQEEITPHKSNTQVTAEEVEIRVDGINSSAVHKHWHTAYHREYLSRVEPSQRRTSNKYGNVLIKKKVHWNISLKHARTHSMDVEEVQALCYLWSPWVVVQDHWARELTYSILSTLH